jgi:hypothetical protein
MRLNGTYCSVNYIHGSCLIFDSKSKIMTNACGYCPQRWGEYSKGKYKRIGSLMVVDWIFNKASGNGAYEITYSPIRENNMINIEFKVVDSTSQEDLIGALIFASKSQEKWKRGTSTDFDGTANMTIDKSALPIKFVAKYSGYNDINFTLSKEQDTKVRINLVNDGSNGREEIGRKFYRVKRIKKDSFAYKQVRNRSEWKFREEELESNTTYYYKTKGI